MLVACFKRTIRDVSYVGQPFYETIWLSGEETSSPVRVIRRQGTVFRIMGIIKAILAICVSSPFRPMIILSATISSRWVAFSDDVAVNQFMSRSS